MVGLRSRARVAWYCLLLNDSARVHAALPLEQSSVVELGYGFAARENRKILWNNS